MTTAVRFDMMLAFEPLPEVSKSCMICVVAFTNRPRRDDIIIPVGYTRIASSHTGQSDGNTERDNTPSARLVPEVPDAMLHESDPDPAAVP